MSGASSTGAGSSGVAAEERAAFPEEFVASLRELTTRYPHRRGALLPILHRLQERRGHVAPADMRLAAELTGLGPAEVLSVVTFYTMYRQRPAGRFPLGVCRNISCWVAGAEKIVATLREELGIGPGETTPDGRFSLDEVECLGSCGTGPCLEIDSRYFENLTPDKVRRLVARLRTDGSEPAAAIRAAQREA